MTFQTAAFKSALDPEAILPVGRAHQLLRVYSKFLCGAVFFLIFKGALVKSFDAGLSVPDWPTTYGQNMFSYPYEMWIGGIFFEHAHRLVASGVGVLTIGLALLTLFLESRRWVKALAMGALGLVIVQGLLGGLTVLLRLPDSVSIAHGMLGQTFLLVVIGCAYALSDELYQTTHPRLPKIKHPSRPLNLAYWLGFSLITALYLQLFLGAWTRHAEGGLAIPDFPTMGGSWLPSFDSTMLASINSWRAQYQLAPVTLPVVLLHAAHRAWALVIAALAVALIVALRRLPATLSRSRALAIPVLLVVIVQISLGAVTVLSLRNPWITSLHVIIGAALLALTFFTLLRLAAERWAMKNLATIS